MGYIAELREVVGTRPLIMAGACVLVFDDGGRLLLQRRSDSGDWGTIGGALEPGESLEEAAARELWEEAGLTARRFRLIDLFSGREMYYRYPHGDEVYNVMAVYEAIETEGIPRVNDREGLELAYFDPEAPIAELNPFTGLVLAKLGYRVHAQRKEA
ncbi:NUDIX hydrolase [Cohnella cellulosilytica]|uniref:NUDIX hydrolase n=1 Tax=Cohnella cellulosilytica TaxID=986710 RepID=A0ABW2F9S6_9BACL